MTELKNKEYSYMCRELDYSDISLSFIIVEKRNGMLPNLFKTYPVNISDKNEFKEKLMKNIINYIKYFENKDCLSYDPLKHKDKTFEYLEGSFISEFFDFKNSFGLHHLTDYKNKITDFNFYVLSIKDNSGNDIHLIRKMNGYKKINSHGIFAYINGKELNQIDNPVIGIDNSVDLIVYNDLIYILNYNSIKKFFNLKFSFQKEVVNILAPVKERGVIDNYDKFERNIRSNDKLTNRLISMKRKGVNFDESLNNKEELQKTIADFELNVVYKNGKILFDKSEDKEAILNLLSDYYYRTTQQKTKGIVDK